MEVYRGGRATAPRRRTSATAPAADARRADRACSRWLRSSLGLVVAARSRPGRAQARHATTSPPGRTATTRRCTRCSTRRRRQRYRESAVRRRVPERRHDRDARVGRRPVTSAARSATRSPCGSGSRTRVFGNAHEILEVPARRQRLGRVGAVLGHAAVPGTAARRALSRQVTLAAARATSARQRRHAARAGTRPHLADPGRRRPDRRHARPDPGRRRRRATPAHGYPRRREGRDRTGSSGSSRTGSPASRAGRCSPARGRSRDLIRSRAQR